MSKEIGHTLLAKLGKKRLRPGGVRGTNWLLKDLLFNEKEILEVASNMATTAIGLAKKYNLSITAIDLDPKTIYKAEINVKKHKLENKIKLIEANATNLPFNENTFDIVINEAMLTMLSPKNKEKAVSEYFRVLKANGVLLTHDVCLLTDDLALQKEIIMELSRVINTHVQPKTINE